jgi:hypothetical protein
MAEDRTPRDFARRRTLTITVARKTDGDGRTKKMNPRSTNAQINKRGRRDGITHCRAQSINAAMIAKFSPLTAVK